MFDSTQPSAAPTQASDITKFNTRLGALKSEFASWRPQLMDISAHLLPRNGRFFLQDRNRGTRRHNAIYDNTGTRALRVLQAGLMSGATSPVQPWLRFACPDKDLMKYQPVKEWCAKVSDTVLRVAAESNTYRVFHQTYGELGAFGTGCIFFQENYDTVINLTPQTMGQYYVATNALGDVDTLYREFQMQVSQMVDPRPTVGFGLANCSKKVQELYAVGTLDTWITVIHVIEPRYDRDASKKDARNMKWKSMWYERSENGDKFLRESGYEDFPAFVPRWDVAGGDIYGNGPGMECLGDIKQLQHEQIRKGQGIDYMTKPPLQLPTSMKGQEHQTLPGGSAFYDQLSPNGGIRSQFNVNLNLEHLLTDIQDVRARIEETFYKPVFQAFLNQGEDPRKTATEVAQIEGEKLLQMGPVVERLFNELLIPYADSTFRRCIKARMLPPPPPELSGKMLNVEFISALALAQRAVTTNSIDRFVGNIGQVANFAPGVLDKFNSDKWVDIYSDALGVNPELVIADKDVAIIRAQRAKQQAQAQQAEQGQQTADAAAKLATIDPSKPNGASAVAAAAAPSGGPSFQPATQPFGGNAGGFQQ